MTAATESVRSASAAEINIALHPKQAEALHTDATEVLYGGAAGGGKALAVDTPIATPSGWTTMGALLPGDYVYGADGNPTLVEWCSEVHTEETYRLTFSDGAEIVCGGSHKWVTQNNLERSRELRTSDAFRQRRRDAHPSRGSGKRLDLAKRNANSAGAKGLPLQGVRTTAEIASSLRVGKRINHSVVVAAALKAPERQLAIDPYTLGVWLGDGHSASAAITSADIEVVQAVANAGYDIRRRPSSKYGYGVRGLLDVLRTSGLISNKHIPAEYLIASENQRLSLLQGLMDTDGYCGTDGKCEFTTTAPSLRDGMVELLNSLGIKAVARESDATLNGRFISKKWRIAFLTDLPAFRLPRKLLRQKRSNFRGTHDRRYIVRAERIEPVPIRCIQVVAADHLFLAGRAMIPTHNSFFMRAAAILWCAAIPGLQVYLFRRIRDDLVKNHMEGPKGFRVLLAPWTLTGFAKIVEDEIRFWNGSKIYLCHCKDEKDVYKYQGSEIHVLLIDEVTHFTESMYRFLRNRVRMVGIKVRAEWAHRFPRIVCGGNPGNVGHLFVKSTWIDDAEPMALRSMPADEGGMVRQYIPARLEDNPSMAQDDPGYEARLQGLGSETLVAAMRHGDWNVVEGAFFQEFSTTRHVLRPVLLPAHWTRARSFDWGSARPFSCGWWAIATEDFRHPDGPVLPRGAIVRYREWYGAKSPNVGLKMTSEEVARGIMERQPQDEKINYGVCDPAAFSQDGGPSHTERMYLAGLRPPWQRADNARVSGQGHVAGWDLVRHRLKGEDYGTSQWQPMLYVFSSCTAFLRTVPALQHDPHRPEDVWSDGEDHVGDEVRYMCASRPYISKATAPAPIQGLESLTMEQVWKTAQPQVQQRRI